MGVRVFKKNDSPQTVLNIEDAKALMARRVQQVAEKVVEAPPAPKAQKVSGPVDEQMAMKPVSVDPVKIQEEAKAAEVPPATPSEPEVPPAPPAPVDPEPPPAPPALVDPEPAKEPASAEPSAEPVVSSKKGKKK